MSSTIALPDELKMGIWGDGGTIWLPKHYFPTRSDARNFIMNETEYCGGWIDINPLSRWMHVSGAWEDNGDHQYSECNKDEPGAFPVWRCE